RTIIERYQHKVKYWFTFNEVNISGKQPFFQAGVSQDPDTIDESVIAQIHHNMFVANAEAIKIIKEINSNLQVACTTTIGPVYSLTPKPEDGLQAYLDNREMLFHIDVHVFGEYPKWKLKEFEDKGIEVDITEEELKTLKENTVDFVAYSYYESGVAEAGAEVHTGDVNVISKQENPMLEVNDRNWV